MKSPPDPLATCDLPIRGDLLAGHQAAWQRLRTAGSWLTGADRLAIAQSARDAWRCGLCAWRRESLSPYGAENAAEHHETYDRAGDLPPLWVDVVHRLVTDPSRLSGSWLRGLFASGELRAECYVEILGTVTQVVSLDALHLALGLEPAPLCEPMAGEPSGYVPPGLQDEDAWVPMISPADLGPDEQDLYGDPTGNVVRALSAVPDEVRAMKRLSAAQYIAIEQMRDYVGGEGVGRSLSRAQMELVAARISALHQCFY